MGRVHFEILWRMYRYGLDTLTPAPLPVGEGYCGISPLPPGEGQGEGNFQTETLPINGGS